MTTAFESWDVRIHLLPSLRTAKLWMHWVFNLFLRVKLSKFYSYCILGRGCSFKMKVMIYRGRWRWLWENIDDWNAYCSIWWRTALVCMVLDNYEGNINCFWLLFCESILEFPYCLLFVNKLAVWRNILDRLSLISLKSVYTLICI